MRRKKQPDPVVITLQRCELPVLWRALRDKDAEYAAAQEHHRRVKLAAVGRTLGRETHQTDADVYQIAFPEPEAKLLRSIYTPLLECGEFDRRMREKREQRQEQAATDWKKLHAGDLT